MHSQWRNQSWYCSSLCYRWISFCTSRGTAFNFIVIACRNFLCHHLHPQVPRIDNTVDPAQSINHCSVGNQIGGVIPELELAEHAETLDLPCIVTESVDGQTNTDLGHETTCYQWLKETEDLAIVSIPAFVGNAGGLGDVTGSKSFTGNSWLHHQWRHATSVFPAFRDRNGSHQDVPFQGKWPPTPRPSRCLPANEASDEGLKGSREGASGRISSSEWRAGYSSRPSRSSRRSSRMQESNLLTLLFKLPNTIISTNYTH